MADYLSSDKITEYTCETGIAKATKKWWKSFLLAFMGGIFIALASIGSIIGSATIDNFSAASVVAGVIFTTGLMMVIIAGGDLYTGNVLVIISVIQKKTRFYKFLMSLLVAFLGNLVGSLFIVFTVNYSSLLSNANGIIVQKLMLKAIHKVEYSFTQAFLLGILCNILVCIAVWMMYGAKDIGGKVWACFFPIMLFILSGYEHIVANMYYIPAAILAATNPEYVKISGLSSEQIAHLTVSAIPHNFIPVLLGNLVGGLIIGVVYNFIYLSKENHK